MRTLSCRGVPPLLAFALMLSANGADLPGSKDPAGLKRYAGSELIGYHAPRFEDFLLPLGTPTGFDPPAYTKSIRLQGLMSRYTYLAPAGRSATELFLNYQQEFQRLGLIPMYQKAAGEKGWFGPTFGKVADEDHLGQILSYNEAQERLLVGRSKDVKPTFYYLFVTEYRDGITPERYSAVITKGRALAELIVVAPQQMEENMTFVNADEMSKSLGDSGKVLLYGINFDTDKDTLRPDSEPTLKEIAKLLSNNPRLNVRVVGHTDNQGTVDHNLDLSRRRAATVVQELKSKYAIAASRLDSFGCGLYAPVDSNANEAGRAKNRRVELVTW